MMIISSNAPSILTAVQCISHYFKCQLGSNNEVQIKKDLNEVIVLNDYHGTETIYGNTSEFLGVPRNTIFLKSI